MEKFESAGEIERAKRVQQEPDEGQMHDSQRVTDDAKLLLKTASIPEGHASSLVHQIHAHEVAHTVTRDPASEVTSNHEETGDSNDPTVLPNEDTKNEVQTSSNADAMTWSKPLAGIALAEAAKLLDALKVELLESGEGNEDDLRAFLGGSPTEVEVSKVYDGIVGVDVTTGKEASTKSEERRVLGGDKGIDTRARVVQEVAPKLDWDPMTETFTQLGREVIDPTTVIHVDRSARVDGGIVDGVVPEPADLSMLMGSKAGDIPEGLVWDAVNESFTQRPVSDERTREVQSEPKEHQPVSSEEDDNKGATVDIARLKEAEGSEHHGQERKLASRDTTVHAAEVTSQGQDEAASSRLPNDAVQNSLRKSVKHTEQKIRDSDGSQNQAGPQKHDSLLGKIKRRMSKAKRHSAGGQ